MNQYETKPTTAILSHESLDVYQLALKFHLGVMTLLPSRGSPTLRDQLERASISIILNIAEGAGRRTSPDRRRHFVIAQGSAYECCTRERAVTTMACASACGGLPNLPVASPPAITQCG